MIDLGKRSLLGINVNVIDYEGAVERISAAARRREPLAVSALAVHGLMTGVLDAEHRYRLNRFDLLAPDGQPVRWALNGLYRAGMGDRVYGPTLMLKVCERAAADDLPIFLFGGSAELLDALRRGLQTKFPRLHIAGMAPSKFRRLTPPERDELVKTIRGSEAAITFIGLGCPRQEVWAYEFRDALSMPLLAVGAAFNFHAGQLEQAPGFLQSRGLEWLFRLWKEPARLWRRYLYLNPLYVALVAMQATGLRSFDPNDARPPRQELLYG
jgi:exopolysaccharide biosynthesis WecB/TagA/CpsF family protein